MAKRTLKIFKRSPIAVGVCDVCGAHFKSEKPIEDDAEAEMRTAFDSHNCHEDASQAAARIARESTRGK